MKIGMRTELFYFDVHLKSILNKSGVTENITNNNVHILAIKS